MIHMRAMLFVVITLCMCAADTSAVDIPVADLTTAEPQVKQKITEHYQRVVVSPRSAEAWGKYGMMLDAHGVKTEARIAYREAVRLAPNDFRWAYYLAHTLMQSDPAEARKCFERAASLQPSYPPTHIWLGQTLDTLGESEKAWRSYERAAELAPNLPWTRLSYGQAALNLGLLDIASRELHAADEMAPDNAIILTQLAKLHARLGDADKAAGYGARASDHMGKVLVYDPIHKAMTDEAVSSTMFGKRATMLRMADMFDEAIAEFRSGLSYAPTRLDLLGGLLDTLLLAKRYDEVLAETDRAFRADMDSATLRRAEAIALCQLTRYDEAERKAKEALALYPDTPELYQVLGYVCSSRGEVDDAVAHLQHSLQLKPDDKDARLGLARVLVNAGHFVEADSELELLRPRMTKHAEFLRLSGMAKLGLKRYDEAIAPLKQSLELMPTDGPTARALASALAALGRFEDAAHHLRDVATRNPQAFLVLNDLAWLLATCPDDEVRNGEEALALAQRAIADPARRMPAMLDTLAAAQAEAGQFEDAVRTMDETIDLARQRSEDPRRIEQYEHRRSLYAAGKPYRSQPAS